MTVKYIRNFYRKFNEKGIDWENIYSLNEYIDWLELNMTHPSPFLKPESHPKCAIPAVVQQRELLVAFRDKLNKSRRKEQVFLSEVDDFLDGHQ